jgi:hypothetical protein
MITWGALTLVFAVAGVWLYVLALRTHVRDLRLRLSDAENRLDRRITMLEEDFHKRNSK